MAVLENKSELVVGQKYYKVELPCAFIQWIHILEYDEASGIFNYANVAKRWNGNIELYDTHNKSAFDDYFAPTRKRNQMIFTDEEEAKAYHESMNKGAFNKMMSDHNLPHRL